MHQRQGQIRSETCRERDTPGGTCGAFTIFAEWPIVKSGLPRVRDDGRGSLRNEVEDAEGSVHERSDMDAIPRDDFQTVIDSYRERES